jgi:hypothetical protein
VDVEARTGRRRGIHEKTTNSKFEFRIADLPPTHPAAETAAPQITPISKPNTALVASSIPPAGRAAGVPNAEIHLFPFVKLKPG